jgi:hypothetical protein
VTTSDQETNVGYFFKGFDWAIAKITHVDCADFQISRKKMVSGYAFHQNLGVVGAIKKRIFAVLHFAPIQSQA